MYCVTGELPAAHGCRPTDTLSVLRCAVTIAGAASASDAAPAPAMKRRRDVLFGSNTMVISPPRVERSSDGRAIRFVTNETPDVLAERLRLRIGARRVVARTRQRHVDHRLEPSGMRRHDGNAVGEKHRLIDRLHDKHDGAALGGRPVLTPH